MLPLFGDLLDGLNFWEHFINYIFFIFPGGSFTFITIVKHFGNSLEKFVYCLETFITVKKHCDCFLRLYQVNSQCVPISNNVLKKHNSKILTLAMNFLSNVTTTI